MMVRVSVLVPHICVVEEAAQVILLVIRIHGLVAARGRARADVHECVAAVELEKPHGDRTSALEELEKVHDGHMNASGGAEKLHGGRRSALEELEKVHDGHMNASGGPEKLHGGRRSALEELVKELSNGNSCVVVALETVLVILSHVWEVQVRQRG
jgi:hypothetical protein